MSKPITENQAIELLQTMMDEIPNHKVYFTMREMKLKGMRSTTINYMRACLAIYSAGLPITSALVDTLLDKNPYTSLQALHNLGDKNCLLFKRGNKSRWGRGGAYEWVIHPVFLKHFYGEIDEHV